MQMQPINVGEVLSKYNFHDHLMTEEDKATRNKKYIVSLRGKETILSYAEVCRLDFELANGGYRLMYREATEEEVKLHNEWLANQKENA